MHKPRLLVIQGMESGVSYHRLTVPHMYLADIDAFEVEALVSLEGEYMYPVPGTREANPHVGVDPCVNPETSAGWRTNPSVRPDKVPLWDYVATFDAVVCSRMLSAKQDVQQRIINKLKALNIKLIVDIDDYWMLPMYHLLQKQYALNHTDTIMRQLMRSADMVLTTTQELACKIVPIAQRIEILPNCIDTRIEQFEPKPTSNDTIRLGWIGGIHHYHDLKIIAPAVKKIVHENTNVTFTIGGYIPHDMHWRNIVALFTDPKQIQSNSECHGEVAHPDVFGALEPPNDVMVSHVEPSRKFILLQGRDIHHYAEMYNAIDICLIPLRDDAFNNCKSPLKLAEAGCFSKPCVVSDVLPYSQHKLPGLHSHYVKNNDNAWYRAIADAVAIEAFNKRNQHTSMFGTCLHTYARDTWHMHRWAERRAFIYITLIDNTYDTVNPLRTAGDTIGV